MIVLHIFFNSQRARIIEYLVEDNVILDFHEIWVTSKANIPTSDTRLGNQRKCENV